MLERTREGDTCRRDSERGRDARDRRQLRAFASAWGSLEAGPTQPRQPPRPRAARLCKNIGHPIWRVLPRLPGQLGSGAAASPAPRRPPFVCVSALIASWLGLLARSLARARSPRAPHLPAAVSGCQAAGRAQARRARQMTGVIYIASTWVPLAVPSDFSRVLPGRKQEALCSRQ